MLLRKKLLLGLECYIYKGPVLEIQSEKLIAVELKWAYIVSSDNLESAETRSIFFDRKRAACRCFDREC